jgi:catechol 2,3-dioxygenase-like lactoylglutathione lyase family enzyme
MTAAAPPRLTAAARNRIRLTGQLARLQKTSKGFGTQINRIHPYGSGTDLPASRQFYVDMLGLKVGMEDPVLGLISPTNPTAQLIICPPGLENPQPHFGIDVGETSAVDAAHTEMVRRNMNVVYPLSDEPWGVRRFFVEDPGGMIVNILAHIA